MARVSSNLIKGDNLIALPCPALTASHASLVAWKNRVLQDRILFCELAIINSKAGRGFRTNAISNCNLFTFSSITVAHQRVANQATITEINFSMQNVVQKQVCYYL